VDGIGLAQDGIKWRALVRALINLQVPWNAWKLSSDCTAPRVVLSSIELVILTRKITMSGAYSGRGQIMADGSVLRLLFFGLHEMLGNYWVAAQLVASRVVLSSIELVILTRKSTMSGAYSRRGQIMADGSVLRLLFVPFSPRLLELCTGWDLWWTDAAGVDLLPVYPFPLSVFIPQIAPWTLIFSKAV
jgi:hypothetical protein